MSAFADSFPRVILALLLDDKAHLYLAKVFHAPVTELFLRHHFLGLLSIFVLPIDLVFALLFNYDSILNSSIALICAAIPLIRNSIF